MIKKLLLMSTLAVLSGVTLQAQTIKVHVAKFAGKQYVFALAKGDVQDTIASGKLDDGGNTVIKIPVTRKGYAGLSQFKLIDGIVLDMIINNENFSVTSTGAPDADNVKFINSPENDFLLAVFQQKQKITGKSSLIPLVLQAYNNEEPIYSLFQKEQINTKEQYAALIATLAKSPLFAAKFIEASNYLNGLCSTLDLSETEKVNEFNAYVIKKLSMEMLYSSSFWSPLIESWFSMHTSMINVDATLESDIKQTLSRINDKEVYTAFANKVVSLLAKAGKDDMVSAIGAYVAKSGKAINPGANLMSAMNGPAIGSIAPKLQTGKTAKTITKKTLLLFFESGCNNCENEIHQLIGNYPVLQEKGYAVVTVSADMTPNAGDGHDHTFPWKEQLCDFKGFKGANFVNYGIIGTPTFFTIDTNGKITGRFARLIDTGIL